ncbi:MAG: SGNH/GDSL hydrolase family protein [Myxococcales bacterium]|nr:SGNH/GDSL hydrolase family protein [Myxococcales bacterium]MDH5306025.1 SGNH/GDSL hydrolase family protein [Myxococcales bacterium]MDH5566092.1 SGNH/GDSL hydrolase family protein [Myxococcales bacterium]
MSSAQRAPKSFYLILVVVNALLFLALEAGTRVYFASRGGSQILWYGTQRFRDQQQRIVDASKRNFERSHSKSVSVHRHEVGRYADYAPDQLGSYAKYLPHQKKSLHSTVTGKMTDARINNHGFRGADFTLEKPDGVVRVVALGASSTFGYGSRDDETYPRKLEEMLNQRAPEGTRFEVLNLGIPHATSDHILSLFLAEGLQLDPDFVILYAGANDSALKEKPGGVGGLWSALSERLLLIRFADQMLGSAVPGSVEIWSDAYAERRQHVFLRNVEALRAACAERGIRFIAVTQQATSIAVPLAELKGLSYEDEVRLVRERVARGVVGSHDSMKTWRDLAGRVARLPVGQGAAERKRLANLDKTRIFLIHARLMQGLREWARGREVGFVDGIAILDDARDLLISWVHLHPEANQKLARALADEILRHTTQRSVADGMPEPRSHTPGEGNAHE